MDLNIDPEMILTPDDVENWAHLPLFIQQTIVDEWEEFFEEEWDGKNQIGDTP